MFIIISSSASIGNIIQMCVGGRQDGSLCGSDRHFAGTVCARTKRYRALVSSVYLQTAVSWVLVCCLVCAQLCWGLGKRNH